MNEVIFSDSPVFILGAGFSKCAGLPVQAEFSNLIVSDDFLSEIDKEITKSIKAFLKDVFGWSSGNDIPSLEDIFTSIDLSSGTGHHLGAKYKPNKLRALRRMLIYRIFKIIDTKYLRSDAITKLLEHYMVKECSFVVLNWDIVLENHLRYIFPDINIDYSTDIVNWDSNLLVNPRQTTYIYKMHGSSNWAYCENCKTLYFQIDSKLPLHKKIGLIKSDFRLFNTKFTNAFFDREINLTHDERKCKKCNCNLSSHIATFSFKKSFRTNAYPSIWGSAEKKLAYSKHWIFIGYSLPEADFEIKHLLKSAELQMYHKFKHRKIEAVIYKDNNTKAKFEKFFGKDKVTVYNKGLGKYVKTLNVPPQ